LGWELEVALGFRLPAELADEEPDGLTTPPTRESGPGFGIGRFGGEVERVSRLDPDDADGDAAPLPRDRVVIGSGSGSSASVRVELVRPPRGDLPPRTGPLPLTGDFFDLGAK